MTKGNEMTKKYIGTKIVTAFEQPDPRPVPAGATPEKGYGVIYEDGYQSWSPASAFEPAYRAIEGDDQALTFGDAIHMLKMGKKVARAGWNGKGMWLRYIGPQDWQFDLPNITETEMACEQYGFLAMKTADNKFVPWLASQTDMLAEDWLVVD